MKRISRCFATSELKSSTMASGRAAVSSLVEGVDSAAPAGEPGAELVIAAAVLPEAMHEDHQAPGFRREPCPAEEVRAARCVETGLDSSDRIVGSQTQ